MRAGCDGGIGGEEMIIGPVYYEWMGAYVKMGLCRNWP